MIAKLIGLGLMVVPFVSIYGQDIRKLKMALAVGIALAISLSVLHKKGFKPIPNKLAVIFVWYIWLATMLAPSPGVNLIGISVGHFWAWKPFFYILTFFLMMSSISSLDFSSKDIRQFLSIMVWSGFAMSVLTLVQFLWLDQFFVINPKGMFHPQWRIAGTLGHPSFVASFIAMIIPISIYLKKKWQAGIMVMAILVTNSQLAIGAMILSLLFLLGTRGKKYLFTAFLLLVLLSGTIGFAYYKSPIIQKYITTSGRMQQWPQIIKDINSSLNEKEKGKWPLTGRGLGSFYYVFHWQHKNRFFQAHNEYLELAYNVGLIGLALFLGTIGSMVCRNFSFREVWAGEANKYRMALLSSFLAVATCAGALFVWQLGACAYYTCMIAGLLHNPVEV